MGFGKTGRMAFAIASSYAMGFLGFFSTSADMDSWYASLQKPFWAPPAALFTPLWLVLYLIMGVALGLVWAKCPLWFSWIGLYYVSLAFNAAWMMFFFGFHTLLIALIDIACLAMMLIVLTLYAWKIDRFGALLMLPYLAWVLLAAFLNAGIYLLI